MNSGKCHKHPVYPTVIIYYSLLNLKVHRTHQLIEIKHLILWYYVSGSSLSIITFRKVMSHLWWDNFIDTTSCKSLWCHWKLRNTNCHYKLFISLFTKPRCKDSNVTIVYECDKNFMKLIIPSNLCIIEGNVTQGSLHK